MLIDEARSSPEHQGFRSSDFRFEDPARPPAPDRRRGLHDAGHSRALRDAFPDAHLAYLVEPAAAPIVAGNPHLDEVIVAPRRAASRGSSAISRSARRLRAGRFDLAIDFHGGPRASLLTWLSGAPDAARLQRRRPRLDVHAACRAAARSCGRGTRSRTSGTCSRRSAIAPPDRVGVPGGDAGRSAAAASIAERLTARRRSATASCSIVVHVSAGNPFRRWPAASFAELAAALAAADRARRHHGHVRAVGARCGGAVIADARARLARETASAVARVRRVFARGTARAGRSRLAVHRRRQRAAARRGGQPACRSSACTARRCRCGRRRGATPALIAESVERRSTLRAARAISASARRAISAA